MSSIVTESMPMSGTESGTWVERLPELVVPEAKMIGNPSRFTNIYVKQPETILLDELIIEAQDATISIERGCTKTLQDFTSDPTEAKQGGIGAALRHLVEKSTDGATLALGERLVYDARRVYNGNLAHLIGYHLARLGYAKNKLGIDTGDCLVVLEKKAPRIAHRLFDMLGFETIETNRAVEATVLDVDVRRYEPYQIYQHVSAVEPAGLEPGGHEKLFISRRSSRRLTNEDEIRDLLEADGYATVYFEEIPLERQWALARDARSVVAIHGAALGYLCAKRPSDPRFKLVEILSPGLVADIFRRTSAALGGHWVGCRGRLTSDFVRDVDESDDFRAREGSDFYLHPEALERALELMDRETAAD